MRRRLWLWLAAAAVVVAGTAGLIALATAGGTILRVEEGRRIIVEGPITGAATERFQRFVEANPGLLEVVLGDNSGTGDVTWLVQMGDVIRREGLMVRATGTLDNDAILLFLAGTVRGLDGGRLVLTGDAAARRAGLPVDSRPVAATLRTQYVERMLGSPDFAAYMAETRATADRVEIGAAEIARFGLATAP
ncbi:hypothetical protein [Roseicyclus persicicus]|uniref:Uncharacterized protein n=1 Tax=Roseicyclus persicicus TaxID=2650661 RepID=A0A7X6H1F0_9RHOB|nr:hypothetical protein [Roseibacterium persicicum]NKX46291.1 hypothetical protein [Roseibacterium persicicum]